MIKQVIAQGDINYLIKIFETYNSINDETEMLKVGGKIIQKVDKLNNKERLIQIMDTIYAIVSTKRKIFRGVLDLEKVEIENGNKNKIKYLRDYKQHLSETLTEIIKKIIKDIKKGIANLSNKNFKDDELFLQLNLADYTRYLCEVSTNKLEKENLIREAEANYKTFFTIAENLKMNLVNQAYLTAIYHYAIFKFEIKKHKGEAIDYLKQKRKIIFEKLDEIYKNYIDSYPIIDMISNTLAKWVIHQNNCEKFQNRKNSSEDEGEIESKKNIIFNHEEDVNLAVISDD